MSLIVYFHHLPFLPCSSFLFAQCSFFTQTLMSCGSEEAASIRMVSYWLFDGTCISIERWTKIVNGNVRSERDASKKRKNPFFMS